MNIFTIIGVIVVVILWPVIADCSGIDRISRAILRGLVERVDVHKDENGFRIEVTRAGSAGVTLAKSIATTKYLLGRI